MKVATIGLDIAKQVFQAHEADKSGRTVWRQLLFPVNDNHNSR
jgi:transposase